jgi:acyl carrier protein
MVSRTGLALGPEASPGAESIKNAALSPRWCYKTFAERTQGGASALEQLVMDTVTDLTLREIGRSIEKTLGQKIELTEATNITRDLQIDSLALMNVVMELEDVFDISIPLDRLAVVETAGDLSSLIKELRTKG